MFQGNSKLKLDLHTHCSEATNLLHPNIKVVRKIIAQIKERGMDGIAITEHTDKDYAYEVKEMVKHSFNDEVMVIPGQEIKRGVFHIVELYPEDKYVFRFAAHPDDFFDPDQWPDYLGDIHGVEIKNGYRTIDEKRIDKIAEKHGLLLLTNSDAHCVNDIGLHYNEISLDELCRRASKR